MLLAIDLQSDEPIYTQICNQIIEGMAKRELLPGDKLPSVRSLGADIGINFHTVNKAYQILKQEGFIQIHRQKGVVIHPDGVAKADELFFAKLQTKLKPLIAESVVRGVTEEKWLEVSKVIFDEMHGRRVE
ncbi:GntR family transcriptional regulator [Listeria monocytogenes]|uniref:GntR family transcriptional regulator n=1 Tax=Listeria monocytogenes TaxID=1639 RepID=A0A3T1H2I1_LISMN|nr:GntR family transcriptional regulator [Listeria monocytogenes]EAF3070116.1 GntR family transcriptional regulator [Listeria monocytogenes serotype 1/2a]EAG6270298.1 GntR family transcriptional regulator [Listeria monocytogenes CFSAN003726]EAG6273456.1 GntR family transcriptional regulator [Listeria monocytogenes CFSAN003808]EAG6279722.1 GntR family transcriptional regulator [Listeria monocytogenes CFSAN003809]EAG6358417.1 GntR family transcriptional regulator [Listeria monocytogenes CFSAN003